MTQWLPVPDYEGIYEVSDEGDVRRVGRAQRTRPGRELSARLNTHGRYQVSLSKDNKQVTHTVHRLVCRAFHGEPESDHLFACHSNGDKTDNRASNLHWGTNADNQRESVAHGTHPQSRKTHCPHGHEYTQENTYVRIRPDGRAHRVCRECYRIAQRQKRAASYVEPSQS